MKSSERSWPHGLLYGVAYYHEYMPAPRLEADMHLLQEAGINVIRVGESTWSLWEPRDGEFDFAWIDPVLDAAHERGIKVILGTPTYALPPWMARKHPEMMLTMLRGGPQPYGGRQNMDITNPDYLRYAERVICQILVHVRNHPAIIGYQIDNETKAHDTASPHAQERFRSHLREKFGTVENLNRTWNLNYWSQTLQNWEEFQITPRWACQAAHLEWARFQRRLVNEFLRWQASLVREYLRPGQFITQNFDLFWRQDQSTGPQPQVDHFAAATALDVAGIDVYHQWGDGFDGRWIALAGDLTRSLRRDNYLVLETQAQAKGWTTIGQEPLYDGQLRQAFYLHAASGANMVAYWPWHSIHNSGETFWRGLLSHDLKPNRPFREAQRISSEVARLGPRLSNLRIRNEVAIVYSVDSFNALLERGFHPTITYADIVNQLHFACYQMGVGVDFITPQQPERFGDYRALLVPPLYVSTGDELAALTGFVSGGGQALVLFKSGFADEHLSFRAQTAPGPLAEAAGINYQEFYNAPLLPLRGTSSQWDGLIGGHFIELLEPTTARPLAHYDHPFFSRYPALTENRFGAGRVIYQGCLLDDVSQTRAVADLLFPNQAVPSLPLIIREAANADGRQVWFAFNFSAQATTVDAPRRGTSLLTGSTVTAGEPIPVGPWDLAIVES